MSVFPEVLTDRYGLLQLLQYYPWFDLNHFSFDNEARVARLYLGHNRKGSYRDVLLRIAGVSSVSISKVEGVRPHKLFTLRISSSSIELISETSLEMVLSVGGRCIIELVDRLRRAADQDFEHVVKVMDDSPPTGLPEIVISESSLRGLICDEVYETDRFAFDKETREARLYLSENYTPRGPFNRKRLRVTDVSEASLEDRAQIGWADIGNVTAEDSTLRIVGLADITLEVGEGCRIQLLHNASTDGENWGDYTTDVPRWRGTIFEFPDPRKAFASLLHRFRPKEPPQA